MKKVYKISHLWKNLKSVYFRDAAPTKSVEESLLKIIKNKYLN